MVMDVRVDARLKMALNAMVQSAERYAVMGKRLRIGVMMETQSTGMDAAVSARWRRGGPAMEKDNLLCAMRHAGMGSRFIHLSEDDIRSNVTMEIFTVAMDALTIAK